LKLNIKVGFSSYLRVISALVLPGGSRFNNGGFSDVRGSANFWSANEFVTNLNNAWIRTLYNSFDNAFRGNDFKQSGFSIRCLRD
jgi:uncharacterized protein (TIGR02145 family)